MVEPGQKIRIKDRRGLDEADPQWRYYWNSEGEMDHLVGEEVEVKGTLGDAYEIIDPATNTTRKRRTWFVKKSHATETTNLKSW